MKLYFVSLIVLLLLTDMFFCFAQKKSNPTKNIQPVKYATKIKVGADQMERYLPLLKNKKVALLINQSSLIKNTLLLDTLLKLKINVVKIFTPEHGLRGEDDAGEKVNSYTDKKTNLPVISLYGEYQKPKQKDLKSIDIVVYDIQDVGVRFYTFISSMALMMEACAENNIEFLVLDQPNPNGFYVDGPVLEKKFASFSGLHPVPIVYGMTVAEYARMLNGERWLQDSLQCKLYYVTCKGYNHKSFYKLPIKPSPNLPNMLSIYLYPSLALFEGTIVSVGRGTEKQFQVIGFPEFKKGDFIFTPKSKPGAKFPMYHNKECNGFDLSNLNEKDLQTSKRISLKWVMEMYQNSPDKKKFFTKNNYFNNLAGNSELKEQIVNGVKEEEIRKSWKKDIDSFKKIRKKYLLYKDFE